MPPSGVALTIRPVAHRAAPSPGIMLACVADAPRDPSHEERNSTQAPRRSKQSKTRRPSEKLPWGLARAQPPFRHDMR